MRRTRFKKKGFRRSKSPASYKKRLWSIFSEFIRRRDADENGIGTCFSCGIQKPWKELQAGHYHARTHGLSLFFDERNVNSQCVSCNMFQRGNLTAYAINLRKKYGEGILEELAAKKNLQTKYSESDYLELIEKYKSKLNELSTNEV